MILKILLLIAVIGIVYFFLIKKKTLKKDSTETSELIECSKCGTYAEIEDSILSNGKYYCSKECL